MSVATKLQSPAKPIPEPRPVLGPAGNRVRVVEKRREVVKQQKPKKEAAAAAAVVVVTEEVPRAAVKNNLSVDSSCSSDSSSSSSANSRESKKKMVRNVKSNGLRPASAKVTGNGEVERSSAKKKDGPVKRCDWITPNSDPLYALFHDKEWGVPVHDDSKLFELLVFSQALAELSWPAILHMRDIFRKLFENFDPSSIAQYTEKKLLSLKVNGSPLLSEPKLRAIVENAKQILKVQQEFGSFGNYCWRFVNHKPLRNGFRYARQVPVKTPKAELISKDLMRRDFRCVGPAVIYSFMQVAGIVNDHLVTCSRYEECNADAKKDSKPNIEETKVVTQALDNGCLSND
ncbi:hypothetical protein Tsubulata_048784 [Turnera subulata]|uniref:Uncharacterized protein n=1 Tax=Turnera subulata TaxID=218843 RepID=A0A9Q0JJD7_9ROSI|nr:hypothetical protein Tsubulata_048784 [Turnera subulata]